MSNGGMLLVSVLPRGAPYGEPALVALDPTTLDLVSYREFPCSEFLPDPETGEPTAVRHARGLEVRDDRLFVALFDSVCEYVVSDVAGLGLSLQRRFASPAAADLHGISLRDRSLAAASTEGGCIVVWDLESQASRSVAIGAAPSSREAPASGNHVNDVCLTPAGLVVCTLTRILALSDGEEPASVLLSDRAALFHDAQLIDEDRLMATDGARGELVFLQPEGGAPSVLRVTDPADWFLRGVEVIDGHAYVLRSQVVRNRQRSLATGGAVAQRGASFGLSVVDLQSGELAADSLVDLPDAAQGSVVYRLAAATA